MTTTHPSKVSFGLLAFVFAVFYAPLVPILMEESMDLKMMGVLGLLSVLFVVILYLFFNTEYRIDDNILNIRSGFFKYTPIDIQEIKQITKSNSILSSPAPSFDRIEIHYGKYDSILISPKDKQKFTQDLLSLNPNIQLKLED